MPSTPRHRFKALVSGVRAHADSQDEAKAHRGWEDNGRIILDFDPPFRIGLRLAEKESVIEKLVLEITTCLDLWEVSHTKTPEGQTVFKYPSDD